MRYFIDTEFLEGPQDKRFLGFKYGQTKPTIDMISIGMVAEDGREYYAISKDFNLSQAWENEWIVNNVLLPIYKENISGDWRNRIQFDFKGMQHVINMVGKSNEQIAHEIIKFVYPHSLYDPISKHLDMTGEDTPEFWAYYADYDWVVFCQLFGRMIDLPKGFPMYCKDLKQLMDNWLLTVGRLEVKSKGFQYALSRLKNHPDYPKQENAHNALDDAHWNKKLYQFLTNL